MENDQNPEKCIVVNLGNWSENLWSLLFIVILGFPFRTASGFYLHSKHLSC